ncbi:MAG: GNAT family N-acetyltransferase [Xanthomonadales bacterium]|nr:GNAT family N-acetyltransferase [Xanthomonadales bacterium]NNL96482.1 GNAT family N-acetyltransferase [Xanthomonadales bacterium]
MRLIAANGFLVSCDLEGRGALADAIEAEVPENWPPELYDHKAMAFAGRQLRDPDEAGWSFWYVLERTDDGQVLVGICGFKGRPDKQGMIEIGYSVLEQFRNRGFASEAVARLVEWAFSHGLVREIRAETFPHLKQSIRVLEKNGFSHRGAGSEHGVVCYAVDRSNLI